MKSIKLIPLNIKMSQKTLIIVSVVLISTVKCDIVKTKDFDDILISDGNDWWKTATVYQIYPRSFKDSNNDGIGDLVGILEKLDYLVSLGVDAIWLSPIFKSPQIDQGYDISDFRDIDPDYGTLDEFLQLIEEAHKKHIKVILDFVPNHTSDQHEWFQKSVSRVEGYEDYYIWEDGTLAENGTRIPPNNWISVFKYSAWTWNDQRQQFFFHQFLKEQPDLNFRNEKVIQEMKDILTYWLDTHDVDGARIDAIPHLIEAANFADEPRSNNPDATDIDYDYLDHIYTRDQPETFDIVYDWRKHFDNITNSKQVSTRILMTEATSSIEEIIKYYGTPDGSKLGAHFSFNFYLLGLNEGSTSVDIANIINEWLNKLPSIYTLNWLLGNHDNHRIASKVGTDFIDGLNMLVAFLPGVQITYNGEEIGMEDGNVTCEEGQDGSAIKDNCTHYESSSRDYERTPFQWDDSINAGFNSGYKTWLPVSPKYKECNVALELEQDKSHLKIYMESQKIRLELKDLDNILIQQRNNDNYLLHITRFNNASSNNFANVYEYLFNTGRTSIENIDVTYVSHQKQFKVLISSINSTRKVGEVIDGTALTLQPYESLILTAYSRTSALKVSYLFLWFSVLLYLLSYF